MTLRIALWIALIIVGLISLDLWQGWGGSLIAARRGVDLIHRLAFWR